MQIVYRYVFWRDGRVRSHEILEKATCKGKFNELLSVPLKEKLAEVRNVKKNLKEKESKDLFNQIDYEEL